MCTSISASCRWLVPQAYASWCHLNMLTTTVSVPMDTPTPIPNTCRLLLPLRQVMRRSQAISCVRCLIPSESFFGETHRQSVQLFTVMVSDCFISMSASVMFSCNDIHLQLVSQVTCKLSIRRICTGNLWRQAWMERYCFCSIVEAPKLGIVCWYSFIVIYNIFVFADGFLYSWWRRGHHSIPTWWLDALFYQPNRKLRRSVEEKYHWTF